MEITDTNYKEIISTNKVTVIKAGADWCGPCRMMAPIINATAELYKDKAAIGEIDVDVNPNFSAENSIRSIPAIFFYKDGVEVERIVGVISADQFKAKIEALLT